MISETVACFRGIICKPNVKEAYNLFKQLVKTMNIPVYKPQVFQSEFEVQGKWYADKSTFVILSEMCWECDIQFFICINGHSFCYGNVPYNFDNPMKQETVLFSQKLDTVNNVFKWIEQSYNLDGVVTNMFYGHSVIENLQGKHELIKLGLKELLDEMQVNINDYDAIFSGAYKKLFQQSDQQDANFKESRAKMISVIDEVLQAYLKLNYKSIKFGTDSIEDVVTKVKNIRLIGVGKSIQNTDSDNSSNVFNELIQKNGGWAGEPFSENDTLPCSLVFLDKSNLTPYQISIYGGVMINENNNLCILRVDSTDKVPVEVNQKMLMWFYKKTPLHETKKSLKILNRAFTHLYYKIIFNEATLKQYEVRDNFIDTIYNYIITSQNEKLQNNNNALYTYKIDIQNFPISYTTDIYNFVYRVDHIDKVKNKHYYPGPFFTFSDYFNRLSELLLSS